MTTQQDEHPWMKPGLGRLAGRVALVTAADSGIGRAAARLFAHEQARPLIILLHGYMAGQYSVEQRFWPVECRHAPPIP